MTILALYPLYGGGEGTCGDGGGGGGYVVRYKKGNCNYVSPVSTPIRHMECWECEYCNSLNKNKKTQCKNCGAPRRNVNE